MPPSIPLQSSEAHDTIPVAKKKTKRIAGGKRNGAKRVMNKVDKTRLALNRADESSNETSLEYPATSADANALSQYSNMNMMAGAMPYGMYSSPYAGMPPMTGGPFSGLYQVIFGVQNVVFSLTQAVQVLGMNQQAVKHAFDSLNSMFDHAIATFHELRALEAMETKKETEEQQKRRKRLKALRWALAMGTSWLVYKLIRRITSRRKRLQYGGNNVPGNGPGYSSTTYNSYPHGSGYGSMYGSSMMHGGLNQASSYGGYPMFGGGGSY